MAGNCWGAVLLPHLKLEVGADRLVVRDEQVGAGVGQLLDGAGTSPEEDPVCPGRGAPLLLLHSQRSLTHTRCSEDTAHMPCRRKPQPSALPEQAGGPQIAVLCSPWGVLPLHLGELKLPGTGSCLYVTTLMACRPSYNSSAFSGQTLRTYDMWHLQSGTHWCISLLWSLWSLWPLLWVVVCAPQVLVCAPLEFEGGKESEVALGPSLK